MLALLTRCCANDMRFIQSCKLPFRKYVDPRTAIMFLFTAPTEKREKNRTNRFCSWTIHGQRCNYHHPSRSYRYRQSRNVYVLQLCSSDCSSNYVSAREFLARSSHIPPLPLPPPDRSPVSRCDDLYDRQTYPFCCDVFFFPRPYLDVLSRSCSHRVAIVNLRGVQSR